MKKSLVTAAVTGLALSGSLTACGADDDGTTTVTVFAASSLKGAFETLEKSFEADHENVDVVFNFAGSSDLVAQIQQGADADVFASADEANMAKLSEDELGAEPVTFASNTLEIAVPAGNPADVSSLEDLTDGDVALVICAPEVPCGSAAVKVEQAAGLELAPVSEEQSVADVLNKVIAGEADAGLVYVTDVIAAGDDVEGIAFPEAAEAVNVYPITTLEGSEEGDLAQAFMDLVLSAEGQAVLADAGFAQP